MELNNLVVFDWDDTLFPTSKIKNGQMSVSDWVELTPLSKLIYDVLIAYINKYKACNIAIVSASKQGWINQSLYMVSTIGHFGYIYNLLFIQNQIKILHPSDLYLPFKNTEQVISWKRDVFRSLINAHHMNHTMNTVNSFISIGDSLHEFKAAELTVTTFDNLYLHRLKLIEHPSFKDMASEMKLLLQFCGVFERSSKTEKANITVDYGAELKKWKSSN